MRVRLSIFFFFSSRRRHTRCSRDWSSDVCSSDLQAVPKHHAFHRAFIRLTPKTLKAVNELVVQAAVKLGLEDGNRLRVDTTVVQSDIHHPTDNTLLWDVVRVVTRLVGRLREAVPQR